MLIFDQLKKNDPQLRALAVTVFCGLAVLLAGLWWVQIVKARDFQAHLEMQSFRSVRIPAVRGKILDRNHNTLAENRPSYNVSLYLDELRNQFQQEYKRLRPVQRVTTKLPFWKRWLGGKPAKTELVRLKKEEKDALAWQARCNVAANAVAQISERLQQPVSFDPKQFKTHYQTRLALPYVMTNNINPVQIARFEEQSVRTPGVDIGIQSVRLYPFQTTAGHLLGFLRYDDTSKEGEDADFTYRLPDYRGIVGIEWGFDSQLRGKAGAKSVLVNNLGYRQSENVWLPAVPGKNVVLTIDLRIQRAAEHALQQSGADTRGAAVVMDVQTGDILALASSPAINPVYSSNSPAWLADEKLRTQINRATQENYAPGSIFKTVIAMAALEGKLNPDELYEVLPDPARPGKGCIYVGTRKIEDTVAPGIYNFRKALIHSSNSYFVTNGLRAGIENISQITRRLHLGEKCNLPTRQETGGNFPGEKRIHTRWSRSDTASISIGQGEIDVTPLQMTVLACAIANGGKVLWPRLVERIEPVDFLGGEPTVFPNAQVRDQLGVSRGTFQILKDAMRDDVADRDGGTGWRANIPGFQICGKTGTAQKMNERNEVTRLDTWFLSFAPYENPRYAVVVMVEAGASGGSTCAPMAKEIYEAILQSEKAKSPQTLADAK